VAGTPSITGYSRFAKRADGQVVATAHYEDGSTKRTTVRVSVEREVIRDGEVIASGEVASTDDSLKIEEGSSL
jgi:hypothetical protein